MVEPMDLNLLAVVAAVMSGGGFGDNASSISDTSIISSMAACSDHIDQVKTQPPYALFARALATVEFLIFG
jgi:Na+/H+ antiporter NhaC